MAFDYRSVRSRGEPAPRLSPMQALEEKSDATSQLKISSATVAMPSRRVGRSRPGFRGAGGRPPGPPLRPEAVRVFSRPTHILCCG